MRYNNSIFLSNYEQKPAECVASVQGACKAAKTAAPQHWPLQSMNCVTVQRPPFSYVSQSSRAVIIEQNSIQICEQCRGRPQSNRRIDCEQSVICTECLVFMYSTCTVNLNKFTPFIIIIHCKFTGYLGSIAFSLHKSK